MGKSKSENELASLKEDIQSLQAEKKQLEKDIARSTRQLAVLESQESKYVKLVSLGELTAGVAHEANNPLTGIQSFTDLAITGLKANDMKKIERSLTNLQMCTEFLQALMNRLLNFVKQESATLTAISIQDAIEDSAVLTRPQLARKQIRLDLDIPPDLPKIQGNKVQVMQVIINLLINAFHAIPHSEGRILIEVYTEPKALIVDVQDNGKGIPKAYQKKDCLTGIFQQNLGRNLMLV